jgi:Cu2+-exporting ATPase
MQETLSCYHCHADLENQSSLQICLDGIIYFFCCSGCLAIAKIIHDQGLEKYYERQIPAEVKPPLAESNDLIINSLRAYDDPILLRRFTQEISEGILETVLTLEKIRCAACVWLCENYLKKIKGVHDVQINYVTLRANIRYDSKLVSLAELLFAIQKIGYYAVPYEASENIQKSQYQRRILLFRLGVAILGMMAY